ncbi:hypothetical protein [Auritidibacter ignavus]|uniref:hypothetical protein n=1 Tax=Auritidibacter ignavus TaxID=678932 RepID=UPI00109CA0BC|nr:hypothetical protein [Auritidibacter ignavus]
MNDRHLWNNNHNSSWGSPQDHLPSDQHGSTDPTVRFDPPAADDEVYGRHRPDSSYQSGAQGYSEPLHVSRSGDFIEPDQPKRGGKSGIWWGLIVLVLVIVAGVLLWIFLRPDDGEGDAEPSPSPGEQTVEEDNEQTGEGDQNNQNQPGQPGQQNQQGSGGEPGIGDDVNELIEP